MHIYGWEAAWGDQDETGAASTTNRSQFALRMLRGGDPLIYIMHDRNRSWPS